MKRLCEILVFLVLLLITGACSVDKEIFVPCNDPQIVYEGRIDTTRTDAAELFWSGTSIKIRFRGDSIGAVFSESRGDNYYNVILDNKLQFILKPDTLKQYYTLASDLSGEDHTLELFKRTEWDRGKGEFYGFQIGGKALVLPRPKEKKRKIAFYGNSITAAYAVEDFSGEDSPDSTYTNNYLSYSAILARHYQAEYHCICKSGIGINISWFPTIMPEIYNLVDPEDQESLWESSLFQPDIIVVNLMQNDSWLVHRPDHESFRARFGEEAPDETAVIKAYKSFVQKLREEHPASHIICALGNMDATREGSPWPGYVSSAVSALNDGRIYTHFVPYKDSPGHPTISEQEDMAQSFISFIDQNINW